MKKSIFIAIVAISIAFPVSVSPRETRCGWYNPDDSEEGGSLLTDSEGFWKTWTKNMGVRSQGLDNLPSLPRKDSVTIFRPKPSLNTTYGCACLEVETDKSSQFITMIYGGEILPLSTCREDPNLPRNYYR